MKRLDPAAGGASPRAELHDDGSLRVNIIGGSWQLSSVEVEGLRDLLGVPQSARALDILFGYGGSDGAHHLHWVIDQVVRALTGPDYEEWVRARKVGEEGPETYDWDEGIPP